MIRLNWIIGSNSLIKHAEIIGTVSVDPSTFKIRQKALNFFPCFFKDSAFKIKNWDLISFSGSKANAINFFIVAWDWGFFFLLFLLLANPFFTACRYTALEINNSNYCHITNKWKVHALSADSEMIRRRITRIIIIEK